jgi:hypothetical protein
MDLEFIFLIIIICSITIIITTLIYIQMKKIGNYTPSNPPPLKIKVLDKETQTDTPEKTDKNKKQRKRSVNPPSDLWIRPCSDLDSSEVEPHNKNSSNIRVE